MMRVERFKKQDYAKVMQTSDQPHLAAYVSDEDLDWVENSEFSRSIFSGEKLLGIVGIVPSHGERGEAWAIVSKGNTEEFIGFHRAVKRLLAGTRLRRIEAVVHCDYAPGHRWVKTLGFELEAPKMKAYTPEGKDAALYALTKGGSNGG